MSPVKYKVLITTSGTGSRLGQLTADKNKALVPVNGRPIIDYLIASYPEGTNFVITLGYLGETVKNYLEENYPQYKFEFVWVDKFVGPGSSLGYSLLQAENKLQCPFIYQACDTIVVDDIPAPSQNWIGGYVTDWSKTELVLNQYRTHTVENGKILWLNDKGSSDFNSIHIGLDGIFDYQVFWEILDNIYRADPTDTALSDVHVLAKMLERGSDFRWVPFSVWLDTGNMKALEDTRQYLNNLK